MPQPEYSLSRQQLLDDVAVDVRQSEITALEPVSQFRVVEAE